jgi:protein gp37
MSTKIEWTDLVCNVVDGCEHVSPGCDHCYADTWSRRQMGHWSGRKFEQVMMHPERLHLLGAGKKPKKKFVCSMGDLFHRDVTDAFIGDVYRSMEAAPQHTFQVLTKRPERMRRLIPQILATEDLPQFGNQLPRAPNIWLGTSVESNVYAWRADMLRQAPAAIRFLSVEPMLGAIDQVSLEGIGWVIVGGESGPGARPIHPEWVRDVHERCIAANIPLFFKQWGAWQPRHWKGDGATHAIHVDGRVHEFDHHPNSGERAEYASRGWHGIKNVGKSKAGRLLDARTWSEFPEVAA